MTRTLPKKERKILVNLYLEKTIVDKCDKIVNYGDTIFEDRSSLLRSLIKQNLPILERDINKQRQERAEE